MKMSRMDIIRNLRMKMALTDTKVSGYGHTLVVDPKGMRLYFWGQVVWSRPVYLDDFGVSYHRGG